MPNLLTDETGERIADTAGILGGASAVAAPVRILALRNAGKLMPEILPTFNKLLTGMGNALNHFSKRGPPSTGFKPPLSGGIRYNLSGLPPISSADMTKAFLRTEGWNKHSQEGITKLTQERLAFINSSSILKHPTQIPFAPFPKEVVNDAIKQWKTERQPVMGPAQKKEKPAQKAIRKTLSFFDRGTLQKGVGSAWQEYKNNQQQSISNQVAWQSQPLQIQRVVQR